ncbi:MAG: YbfB/YjiJ family MFS transporter [Acetobacteraceae bacterium]
MIWTHLQRALAGAAATGSGNGLARFAYVPLFPAMVQAGWVDGGGAGFLGAAALGGYLLGTLGASRTALRFGVPRTLDIGMALIVVSLAACAWNGGFWWLAFWRSAAGVAGGFLMGLAGPATLASVPAPIRGAAGGIVISGVGMGITAGALLVPALLMAGVAAAWAGLAATVALLWVFSHHRWPDMTMAPAGRRDAPRAWLLVTTYSLHSVGMVPPMVYLADLAARGRGLGVTAGAMAWFLFGLGGVAGGILSGRVTDRIGGRPTLLGWLCIQSVALALCLPPLDWLVLAAAAVAGFAAVGVSTVTLTVSRELAPEASVGVWVRCTAAFGITQTVVAFALAALFAATGESHLAVFAVGTAASCLAVASAAILARRPRPPRPSPAPSG